MPGHQWVPVTTRSSLRWLIATGFAGLLTLASVAYIALHQIKINGPIYQRISLSEDVVTDYVPPAESLLQAAVICSMISNESNASDLSQHIEMLAVTRVQFEK